MTTKFEEEDSLHKKVWRIINLIQVNQLFVYSNNLELKYLNEKRVKIPTEIRKERLFD